MTQPSYALAALLAPFVVWYLVAPVARLFGWSRVGFTRVASWAMVALAIGSLTGLADPAWRVRLAWAAGWLLAALIGWRIASGIGWRPRRTTPLTGLGQRYASLVLRRTEREPQALALLCEQRIGRRVLAASRMRVTTAAGTRTHALALTHGVLWLVEIRPWRRTLGPILTRWPLDGAVVHTKPRRCGRYLLELSRPAAGELVEGILVGASADAFVGQITAEQFARTRAHAPAPEDGR